MSDALPRQRGKPKVFLGYAAGVGKTCRMLQECQQLRREGHDLAERRHPDLPGQATPAIIAMQVVERAKDMRVTVVAPSRDRKGAVGVAG